jgi:hypothetical protein
MPNRVRGGRYEEAVVRGNWRLARFGGQSLPQRMLKPSNSLHNQPNRFRRLVGANVAAVAVVRRPRSVFLSQVGDCLAELSVCRKAQDAVGDETKIRDSSEKGQRRLDGVGVVRVGYCWL